MNPNELFSFREVRWFENILATSFVTAVVAVGFIAMAVYGGNGSLQESVGLVGAFAIVVVGAVGGGYFARRYENQRMTAISARLPPLTTSQLVALSGSPEVNEWNRSLVTDFLNQNRGGWSFEIDTVNTTTS